VYGLYGKEDVVRSAHFETGHNYNRASREAVYAFFGTHLQGRAGSVDEQATVPAKEDLLWGSTGGHSADEAAVLAAWTQRISAGLQGLGAAQRRERLGAVLGVQWPERVDALLIGDRLVLQRAGSGDRVPALWQPGRGKGITVVVDAGGIDTGRKNARAKELAAAGEGLLYVRPFRTGGGGAPRHDLEYLTFHRSDDANRVRDIVTALAYVEGEPVRLVCPGRAGAWCALAAAVSAKTVVVEREAAGQRRSDPLILPGLQLAGGMETTSLTAR